MSAVSVTQRRVKIPSQSFSQLDYGYLSGRSFPVIDPVCSLKGAIVRTSTRLTHFVHVGSIFLPKACIFPSLFVRVKKRDVCSSWNLSTGLFVVLLLIHWCSKGAT